jgi:hypothetical protein
MDSAPYNLCTPREMYGLSWLSRPCCSPLRFRDITKALRVFLLRARTALGKSPITLEASPPAELNVGSDGCWGRRHLWRFIPTCHALPAFVACTLFVRCLWEWDYSFSDAHHARVARVGWGVSSSTINGPFGGALAWSFDGGFHATTFGARPTPCPRWLKGYLCKGAFDLVVSLASASPEFIKDIWYVHFASLYLHIIGLVYNVIWINHSLFMHF